MRTVCDRPGCVRVAAVAFAFDGVNRVVRMHDPHTPGAAGLLCARHAALFRPPQGWTVVGDAPGAPTPTDATAPITVPVTVPVDDTDDFERLLDASSPLLARAFRTAHPGAG
jgi:hypothetical protein